MSFYSLSFLATMPWKMYKNLSGPVFFSLFVSIVVFTKLIDCELYEGSTCYLENRKIGVCMKLQDCPPRAQEVRNGTRTSTSTGRCAFDGFIEIVCCPVNLTTSTNIVRPIDIACQQIEKMKEEPLVGDGPHFIHHGLGATSYEYPFMVALGYQGKNEETDEPLIRYNCGGTLISLQHVLTAAHCVANIDERVPIEVLLGTSYLQSTSSDVQRIPIKDIIVHPKYKRSTNYNDVAILKLSRKIRVTAITKPACLFNRTMYGHENDLRVQFDVPGWGITDFDEATSAFLMKTPYLRLVGNAECNKSYVGFSKLAHGIDHTFLCAIDPNSTRGSDACHGDSGGPLVMYFKEYQFVAGITAFGAPCGSYVPGVYTAIYTFLKWIEQIVWPIHGVTFS